VATSTAPVIHHYLHSESGGVHGFTHPLHPEIAKQVKAGELVRVADSNGTDPDTEIARLRAQLAALAKATGVDLSTLEGDGLADTSASSAEALEDDRADEGELADPDDEEDDDADGVHTCLECGDPVERKGKTGPWPLRHPGCK
jgi:hypothetical protein